MIDKEKVDIKHRAEGADDHFLKKELEPCKYFLVECQNEKGDKVLQWKYSTYITQTKK